MLLRYLGAILPPHDSKKRETVIAWSPDSSKLAVTSANCMVYLFDDKGTKKDEFSTKALNAKNHSIKGIAFSPDSKKLAVGHSDGFIRVYDIGEEWGQKTLEFELHQGSAITCLLWATEELLVTGLENGKVNTTAITNRTIEILCDTGSTIIALATNARGTCMLSSHADGRINRYQVTETGLIEFSGQAVVHPVAASALAWTHHNYVLAGGRDRRLTFYDSRGKPRQVFSYCGNPNADGIIVSCCSPSGQNVAIGTCDGMRILNLSPRTTLWEDTVLTTLPKGGPVIALSWRRDGSQLVVGGLNGGAEHYEVALRSPSTFSTIGYEVLYIEPTLAIVSSLGDEHSKPIVVRSRGGHEIEDVKLLGNHIIARTSATLIICELNSDLVSEIPRENDKDTPTSHIRLSVESAKSREHQKIVQEVSKGSVKDVSSPKRVVATVSFAEANKSIHNNGISAKTRSIGDLMMSRLDQSKYPQSKNKCTESDSSSLSACSMIFPEVKSKNDNGGNLCTIESLSNEERKERAISRKKNTNNFVYSTVKGDTFSRDTTSSTKTDDKDKIINISSNRKTCKFTTEDSMCWTLSLDSRSSGQVSENEAEQKQRQTNPETIGINFVSSSVTPVSVVQNTSNSTVDQSYSSRKDSQKTESINCSHSDVSGQECTRCRDVGYKLWAERNQYERSSSMSSTPEIPLPGLTASSPIRFTRQYTPEELRGDFSLQLAVMASLPAGLQRILEKQSLAEEKN